MRFTFLKVHWSMLSIDNGGTRINGSYTGFHKNTVTIRSTLTVWIAEKTLEIVFCVPFHILVKTFCWIADKTLEIIFVFHFTFYDKMEKHLLFLLLILLYNFGKYFIIFGMFIILSVLVYNARIYTNACRRIRKNKLN